MSLTISKRDRQAALKTFAAGRKETDSAIKEFFKAIDTPRSLACWLLYDSIKFDESCHRQLLELEIDPMHYCEGQGKDFHLDYLATCFLSKSDFLQTGYDTKDRALVKLLKTEVTCLETNRRLRSEDAVEKGIYGAYFFSMRHKISDILGDFDIEEFFESPAWGPGSTTKITGCDVGSTRKFQEETGITAATYTLLGSILPTLYPTWFGQEDGEVNNLNCHSTLTISESNTVFTVPKNSKTDRVAAKEPGINSWFQKSAGDMIRCRLKRRGIDLDNQSINQKLSKVAVAKHLATVDFSSASDTIAFKLVEYLLPIRWFTVLNALRCKSGKMPSGETITWQKFSSMGNGFTFELEALIFYAAALVACDHVSIGYKDVSVYGDDVIIPEVAFAFFQELCTEAGFSINADKSFSSGLFRESCGSHWFETVDVKPIYFKKELSDAFSVFKLANGIRRLSHRRNNFCGCDRRFLPVWRNVLQRLPNPLRDLKISEGYGDGGVLSNFDEASPTRLRNDFQYLGKGSNMHEGFKTLCAVERGVTHSVESPGLLLTRLNQIKGIPFKRGETFYMRETNTSLIGPVKGLITKTRVVLDSLANDTVMLRGLSTETFSNNETFRRRTRARITELVVPAWYNLGAWY